jgi:hypothetical protein
MEWTPLEVADLHQMLMDDGGTLESTLMRKQSDMLGKTVSLGMAILRDDIVVGLATVEEGLQVMLGAGFGIATKSLWRPRKLLR